MQATQTAETSIKRSFFITLKLNAPLYKYIKCVCYAKIVNVKLTFGKSCCNFSVFFDFFAIDTTPRTVFCNSRRRTGAFSEAAVNAPELAYATPYSIDDEQYSANPSEPCQYLSLPSEEVYKKKYAHSDVDDNHDDAENNPHC